MALTDWNTLHGDHFRGAACVVTGGAGFIGSHLTDALLGLGASVTVLDDLSGGDPVNLEDARSQHADRLRFVEGDIQDRTAVEDAVAGARYVFHQAAWGSVPRSVEMPERYHGINVTGTLHVLEAAKSAGAKRVVFAASSSCYGDTPTLPKVETMPVRPRSPYAANKVACEAMMRGWACSYGAVTGRGDFDTVALRYFNIFGPRQNSNSAYAAVIAAFAAALLDGRPPVIFGDGEQSRDFTFVDNAVHANLLAARSPDALGGEAMNIACGRRVTINELAQHMAGLLGRPDLKPEHRDERAGDVKHSLADLGLAKDRIGYTPQVAFEDGLTETVAWYRDQHSG